MNVFVLSTGRCGSETFARACRQIKNYTAAHESYNPWLYPKVTSPYRSLQYPPNHIEVDNRLSWFLGTLEKQYGQSAFYVHLLRRREEVARSLTRRGKESILFSFASGVLQYFSKVQSLSAGEYYQIGLQYWDTVNNNIEHFIRDKNYQMTMWLDDIKDPFRCFWERIGAEGDLEAALSEWNVRYNATKPNQCSGNSRSDQLETAIREVTELIPQRKSFILVDEEQWGRNKAFANYHTVPFLERNGRYWGPPSNDDTAIRELERLRETGANYIVFGWPAFWWLDHYTGLRQHLRSNFRCLLDNDRLVVFDLGLLKGNCDDA